MNTVHVLDCTLRDGGYCNQWRFGFKNIKKISTGLVEAGIDVIECGFLTNRVNFDKDVTKYTDVEQIEEILPKDKRNKLFVAMMNYGEYDVNKIPICNGKSVDGIRVTFHKKNVKEALKICKEIKAKRYKVFVQPMVSLSYTDDEFLELISEVNRIDPYAFYIVDSFGMMKSKDLIRLFYMVEHNLQEKIWIGFHSHNNMQLAYSNAQTLVGVKTSRNLIIDSSVYGMGRGAGNLNTELFIDFLNENYDKDYLLKPILNIIDEILSDFYQRNYWGYSLPNYISAAHNAHPNYAGYLDDKKTLTVENIDEIFDMMDDEKKFEFDKKYIEELYQQYMTRGKIQEKHNEELKTFLKNKTIVLIAPGKSSVEERKKIQTVSCNDDVIMVSINFEYDYVEPEFIFLSNIRRYKELDKKKLEKCIITSNVPTDKGYIQAKYNDLVNMVDSVRDNAGLMAVKFFMTYEVKEILLAGFDGYSHDVKENYANTQMSFISRNAVLDAMNEGMTKVLQEYKRQIKITFLTEPHFVKL